MSAHRRRTRLLHPATDALAVLGLNAATMLLRDVAHDGSRARDHDKITDVDVALRRALVRIRTSRRLSGCLSHEPFLGLFDDVPGTRRRRR